MQYRKLDIRLLAREGALAVGFECSVQWNRGNGPRTQLHLRAYESKLHFRYSVDMPNSRRSEAGIRVALT